MGGELFDQFTVSILHIMNTIAFLENINGPEIILIFLAVLLLFGAERLPGLFKSFGQAVREFKKATSGIEEDIRSAMDTEPAPAKPRSAPPQAAPRSAPLTAANDAPEPATTPVEQAEPKDTLRTEA